MIAEDHPVLQGNTVQAAKLMRQSGTIPKLFVFVVSLQHAHNEESYVKLEDPTGTIGGTFTSDVLSTHQGISRGAVLLLEKITILKTPSPHSMHHACITSENIVKVISRQAIHANGSFNSSALALGRSNGGLQPPPLLPAPGAGPPLFSQQVAPTPHINQTSIVNTQLFPSRAQSQSQQHPSRDGLTNNNNNNNRKAMPSRPSSTGAIAAVAVPSSSIPDTSGPNPAIYPASVRAFPYSQVSTQPPLLNREKVPVPTFQPPPAVVPHQPRIDTAEDLLADLDDEFGF